MMFAQAWLPMLIADHEGKVVYENKASEHCLGLSYKGKNLLKLFVNKKVNLQTIHFETEREKIYSHFYRRKYTKRHNLIRIDEHGKIIKFPAILLKSSFKLNNQSFFSIRVVDISEEIKHEDHLFFIAHHDHLTNLENRRAFVQRMKVLNDEVIRYKRQFGLFYIDINNFKKYNDFYGHHFGDQILKRVADALLKVKRASDNLYRVGGDEFVFIADGLNNLSGAKAIGKKMIQEIDNIPIIVNPKIAINIGSTLIKQGTEDNFQSHIKFADKATRQAKVKGKDQSYHMPVNYQSNI